MKNAKSYKEYRKIIRKYKKYKRTDKRFPKACYDFYTVEQVNEVYNVVKHWKGCTYKYVLENFHNVYGCLAYACDWEDVFIIKGMREEYPWDPFYILEDVNGEICYSETEYVELLDEKIYENPKKLTDNHNPESIVHLMKFKEILNGGVKQNL